MMNAISHPILVVIPDKPFLELLGELIESLGHCPVLCRNEQETLKVLGSETRFAVGAFGWELSQKKFPEIIRNSIDIQPRMRRFVLIDQMDAEIRKLIQNGDICCYLKKPFTLEKFETAFSQCLQKFHEAG